MRIVGSVVVGFALVAALGLSLSAQEASTPAAPQGRAGGRGRGAGPISQLVWSPKAIKPGGWTAPHKPHTKLSDFLTKHKGQADWIEPVVNDDTLHADYISMAPGKKTSKRMNSDSVEWWVIQDGQVRFNIDGQEPFVASKGYLVQVPYRNMYTMETVGDRPSLRFEVNVARARKMYAMEETPAPIPGNEYVAARVAGKGTYEGGKKPFVDFNAVVAGTDSTRQFVVEPGAFANIILGRGIAPPPLTEKGHFHQESAEFWFIMLGKIRYNIEGLQVFEADQGDIVYAPKQRWHLASFGGDVGAPSCRLAMNGFSDLAHSFETANAR
jgi:mannose-6-phosphate isomerase-like protein (cupin superfamily)